MQAHPEQHGGVLAIGGVGPIPPRVKYDEDPPWARPQINFDESTGAPRSPRSPRSPKGEPLKTIGDALEEAGHRQGDKQMEVKDARALQSAEARATGLPAGVRGGPISYAKAVAEHGVGGRSGLALATFEETLQDAKSYLPMDKVVTQQDAKRVASAERRNDPERRLEPGGVAECVQEAADANKGKI